ncbi:MAG: hypothetical protein ABIJ09_09780 [Pseudomonadota bacterium]
MIARSLTVLGMLLLTTLALAAPPKKIFVSNLKPRNVDAAVTSAIDGAVCNAVHQDKRFTAVCPDEVKAVMAYDALGGMLGGAQKCEGDDCTERLAKSAQADAIVAGSVAKLAEKKFVVTLEMISTVDGKNLGRVEEQVAGGEDVLYERTRGAVTKLLASIK